MVLKEFMNEKQKRVLEWRVEALAANPPVIKQNAEKRKSDSVASNSLEATIHSTDELASQFQKSSHKKMRSSKFINNY